MVDQTTMMKRQQVLAAFGEYAIRAEQLDDVLTEACRLVGTALGTARAKILEIQEGRQELLVRAGAGWAPDVVGRIHLSMSDRSSETYSINVGQPVISRDIAKEDRFDVPNFMKDAGVAAFVNVPIFVPGGRPYGVLQVDDTKPRDFGEDEVQFLRTYAMILGPVIDRLHLVEERARAAERLRESETRYQSLFDTIDEGYCLVEVVRDENGAAIDLIPREVNRAWLEKTGVPDPVGKRWTEVMPDLEKHLAGLL